MFIGGWIENSKCKQIYSLLFKRPVQVIFWGWNINNKNCSSFMTWKNNPRISKCLSIVQLMITETKMLARMQDFVLKHLFIGILQKKFLITFEHIYWIFLHLSALNRSRGISSKKYLNFLAFHPSDFVWTKLWEEIINLDSCEIPKIYKLTYPNRYWTFVKAMK